MIDFKDFNKIYRWSRDCIITEKIDGTNAQIHILEDGTILAGSRNRYIIPEEDNFGFAKFVKENEDELRSKLGVGRHFGEWWGQKIQRSYDLKEKRFSLFNVTKWNNETKPNCCSIVPIICSGPFGSEIVQQALDILKNQGSLAAPGFLRPEGIVIFHIQSGHLYKKTFEKDQEGKGVI